jgi:hypothetical protein
VHAHRWLAWVAATCLLTQLACKCEPPPEPQPAAESEPIVYACRDPAVPGAGVRSGYRFEIDGFDRTPAVTSTVGRPGEMSAGDVVYVGGIALVLEGPGHHSFRVSEDRSRVTLSREGESPRLVGLRVDGLDTLAALTDEERRGLRGVQLFPRHDWGDALTVELARLPLEHVVVSHARTYGIGLPVVPSFPDQLRYLVLEISDPVQLRFGADSPDAAPDPAADPESGVPVLGRLTKLRFLALRGHSIASTPFDVGWLRGLAALEHLELAVGGDLANTEALEALEALLSLDLSWVKGTGGLAPVASLSRLRWLGLRHAGASSLAPLAGHPSLEVIDARGSTVTLLPDRPLPALRDLVLVGSEVDAETAAAFTRKVPQARVAHGFNQTLADTAACADRIRIRTGGQCHRVPERETTLFEVRDAARVRAFLPLLSVREKEHMGHCMCCGDPTIELYQGEHLVAAVGFHHGKSLRWNGWPEDRRLAENDAHALCRWLAEHGATEACAD